MTSILSQIAGKVKEKLSIIQQANGFNTDAGLYVYLGRQLDTLSERDAFPFISISLSDGEFTGKATGSEIIEQSLFIIEAHNKVSDLNDCLSPAIALLEDLRKVVYSGDRTLSGLIKSLNLKDKDHKYAIELPEAGESIVSVALGVKVEYVLRVGADNTLL